MSHPSCVSKSQRQHRTGRLDTSTLDRREAIIYKCRYAVPRAPLTGACQERHYKGVVASVEVSEDLNAAPD